MRKLNIFDDGEKIATITQIDSSFFVFARSSREWSEMKRLSRHLSSLEQIADKVHNYNFSTELI